MQIFGTDNGSTLPLPSYNDNEDDKAPMTPLIGIQLPDLSNVDVCNIISYTPCSRMLQKFIERFCGMS